MALSPLDLPDAPVLDPEEVPSRLFADLQTQAAGLDDREAARRLLQLGPNEIRRESGPRWWRSLLEQFRHPLALQLRNLQTMVEIGVDKNSTIMFPAPLMTTIQELGEFLHREAEAAADPLTIPAAHPNGAPA